MFRRLMLLSSLLLFALPIAHADEASKRAKIQEMFTLIKMDSLMQQVMSQGMAQAKEIVKGAMGDTTMTANDKKIADEYTEKMIDTVSDTLSWKKLEPAYVDLYASAYSEEEIDGIVTFYKSPVGQSLLAKTPELMTKSGAIVLAQMQGLAPRIQAIAADLQAQLKAAHPETASGK